MNPSRRGSSSLALSRPPGRQPDAPSAKRSPPGSCDETEACVVRAPCHASASTIAGGSSRGWWRGARALTNNRYSSDVCAAESSATSTIRALARTVVGSRRGRLALDLTRRWPSPHCRARCGAGEHGRPRVPHAPTRCAPSPPTLAGAARLRPKTLAGLERPGAPPASGSLPRSAGCGRPRPSRRHAARTKPPSGPARRSVARTRGPGIWRPTRRWWTRRDRAIVSLRTCCGPRRRPVAARVDRRPRRSCSGATASRAREIAASRHPVACRAPRGPRVQAKNAGRAGAPRQSMALRS